MSRFFLGLNVRSKKYHTKSKINSALATCLEYKMMIPLSGDFIVSLS